VSAFLFLAGLGLSAAGAVAGLVLPGRIRAQSAGGLTAAGCLAVFTASVRVLVTGMPVTARSGAILPLTGAVISLDRFGAVFAAVTAVVGAAVSCYAAGYLARGHQHRADVALLPLFVTSLLAVPAAASIATFMAAWELMALSSLLLLLTGHKREQARAAAQWYAVMTHAGAAAILLAFVILSAHAGGQSFTALRQHADALGLPVRSAVFLLALTGFASKAGAVPLHVWLPRAHPEAPGPVSALMSGAMVNLGVYGIVRVGMGLLGGGVLWWWLAVAALGVASALFGGLHCAASADLKRLLAYSTVDNMGLMLTGVGASGALQATGHAALAALVMTAALFQLASHAAFKGCLFLGASTVQRAAGSRDLDRLGGLARRMPATAALFGIGAAAICALPPFSGFASEWLLLQGLLRGFSAHGAAIAAVMLAGVAALALTGGLTAAAFVKAAGIGFLGQPRTAGAADAREAGPAMTAGTALLAAACVALGVVPGLVLPILARAGGAVLGTAPLALHAGVMAETASTADVIEPALLGAMVLGLGVLAWAAVQACGPARGRASLRRAPAWGCGGEPQTARMQYTATSFADPLQRVFDDVLRPSSDLEITHLAESRYFTAAVSYRSRVDDAIERDCYRPVIALVRRWGQIARHAQNGSLHRYLGYGLAALVIVLAVLA
jgi:hydrogenase-4 component B